ncbi:SEL1-like repeat protein [Jiella sonneratiae]|uniref:SEL1-like repeat protein n=1 Tax=Jiella sonneratiae TaxID=2816856 RepID=A0ABS3J6D1_9HYPH|nr:SEL1-like repeat protein [Jiella sonneratiae]MBO0905234.1 SEL1-like repeat protein [Jiella sonneratiae]
MVATHASGKTQTFGAFTIDDATPTVIRLKGQITARESCNFRAALRAAPQARTVELDSPGGSLIIALEIADTILDEQLSTVVPQDAQCLSACAFVFFAGSGREVKGALGVHQIASTQSNDFQFGQLNLSDAADFMNRAGVSPGVLPIMLVTPPDQMHVFSQSEIASLRINRTAAPSLGLSSQRPAGPTPDEPTEAAEIDKTVRLCEELAADRFDPARPAGVKGVYFEKIEADRAVPACRAAQAAHPTEPRLQFLLGRALDASGSEDEAVAWFRKAAEQGDAEGQASLGAMYSEGTGVEKDLVQAVAWFRKAAEQGDTRGQISLGNMYADGTGVEKDLAQAVAWFRKAAEQGDARGQTALGTMYANGRGVEKDPAQAVAWYRKAAEQGDAPMQAYLGAVYLNGILLPKDEIKAEFWYRKAAEQGDYSAKLALERMGK